MIRDRADLDAYLRADRAALEELFGPGEVPREVLRFQRRLRQVEYGMNRLREHGFFGRLVQKVRSLRFHRQSIQCNFEIPPNTFGPGLAIAGRGTIVVHPRARIGARCTVHPDVTIGTRPGPVDAVPTIGADATIGPGARIFGPIVLGDAITIGANAVVNRSFRQRGITITGAPAHLLHVESVEAPAGPSLVLFEPAFT